MYICKMEIKIIKSKYNIQIMRRLQETLKKKSLHLLMVLYISPTTIQKIYNNLTLGVQLSSVH